MSPTTLTIFDRIERALDRLAVAATVILGLALAAGTALVA
jgi:hypothetical protein